MNQSNNLEPFDQSDILVNQSYTKSTDEDFKSMITRKERKHLITTSLLLQEWIELVQGYEAAFKSFSLWNSVSWPQYLVQFNYLSPQNHPPLLFLLLHPFPPNSVLVFWVSEKHLGGSDHPESDSDTDPALGLEPSVGSNLGKMVLMLKELVFTAAKPAKISTETMLNRFFSL